MITHKKILSVMISAIMVATLLPLTGCNKKTPDQPTTQTATTTPQSVYVPPTADQLYQMVGPIALFPDKLVAQVLAGSSYPDQITAADNWDLQNKNLTTAQRQSAVNQQPWDVSVKGLAMFPDVLDQMAKNLPWTTALGTAYVNDPTDVMNAIQVMRQRASTSGNLKASKQQKIMITPRIHRSPDQPYDIQQGEPIVYSGPNVISPPDQTIVIEPADPDVVYVPSYNPRVAYGEPMQYYPGYQDYEPQQGYSTGEIVTAGALTFGAGVAIAALSHHDGGWNSWGVHWGGHRHDYDNGNNYGQDNKAPNGGWHRPAVEYNNSTYVSRSTTVINQVNNENNYYNQNNINTRNTTNNNYAGENNRNRPSNNSTQPNFSSQANISPQPNFAQPANGRPERGEPAPNQPNFNGMHEPHFNKTEIAAAAGAAVVGGAVIANSHFNHAHEPQNSNLSGPPTAPNFNNPSQPNFGHHESNGSVNAPHPAITQNPTEIHQQQGWMQHGNGSVNAHIEQHQQVTPPVQPQPQQNPAFEHHQWGHQDQQHQPAPQTSSMQTSIPAENHYQERQNQPVQPSITPPPQPNPTFEHRQWGHQDQPHQIVVQTPAAPQPSNPAPENHHQWEHPSQPQAEQPQAHIQPIVPQPQPVAAVHPQTSPAPEHHQWGQLPVQKSAPQVQQPPHLQQTQPAAPHAHANHPHPDKKDEGFNHNQ